MHLHLYNYQLSFELYFLEQEQNVFLLFFYFSILSIDSDV